MHHFRFNNGQEQDCYVVRHLDKKVEIHREINVVAVSEEAARAKAARIVDAGRLPDEYNVVGVFPLSRFWPD